MQSIIYGAEDAPHQLVSFFEIGCSRCSTFFLEKFPIIKQAWVENHQLKAIFKPYPRRHETIAFMSCCEGLTEVQKTFLFELLMETDYPTIDSIYSLTEMLKGQAPTSLPNVLEEAVLLTEVYQFDRLPQIFFDDWPLSEENQESLICFLNKI
jgi:hypothetical protein